MAKTKPELSLLGRFILSLIKQHVNTLYLINREAGISVGAASPVLRYLRNEWFVEKSSTIKKGRKAAVDVRQKVEYEIVPLKFTATAANWLEDFGEIQLTDTESVARIVALAEEEKQPDLARKTLVRAIRERRERANRPAPPREVEHRQSLPINHPGLRNRPAQSRGAGPEEDFGWA